MTINFLNKKNIILFIIICLICIFFYTFYSLQNIPSRFEYSGTTMLMTDQMRTINKIEQMSQRSYSVYLLALATKNPDLVHRSINYMEAAIGFVYSEYADSQLFIKQFLPIVEKNLEWLKTHGLNLSETELQTFSEGISLLNREAGQLEQQIWADFQHTFVQNQIKEHRLELLYQVIAAILLLLSVVIALLMLRERSLYRLAQESENRFKTILEHAPIGILIANKEQMQFQYANPAICKMLGYKQQEMEQMEAKDIHKNIDHEHVRGEFQQHLEDKKTISSDIQFLKKDGSTFEADVFSAPILLEEQPCLLGFIVDQSARKKLQSQLNRAQKMEAIGLMAGGVAHDLNNILAGIISYPELLRLKLPESDPLQETLKKISESGQRAANVVSDLLTIARGSAVAKETCDLNEIIQGFMSSPEQKALQKKYPLITCKLDLDAINPTIHCSPTHISNLLMNLIRNAAEAIEVGGKITISTYNQQVDESSPFDESMPLGDYLVLQIRDNGPGIPAKDLNHIFEPFYSTKMMGQSGTGLGLSVVWNIVKDHDGYIFVHSNEESTTFEIFLPVNKSLKTKGNNESIDISKYKASNEHVLVVDDEIQMRDIASGTLTSLNYQVTTAESGEEAIKRLKEKTFDLVFLDMMLGPGMNGLQTYQEIKRFLPGQKVVITSGYAESKEVKEALNLGAQGFISKPYTIYKLGEILAKALA